jgi:hypothetical protein
MLAGLLFASCSVRETGRTAPDEETPSAGPPFDPLATATDREVVPEVYPIQTAYVSEAGDSLVEVRDVTYDILDSSASALNPREVYRIQIFTSRLYTEANRELALAEEIFNLPVHLDYEVPYYKLRVGDFSSRVEAEDMLPEIRAIGYRDAWVARVVLRIRQAPPFDFTGEPLLPLDSAEFSPIRPDTVEAEDEINTLDPGEGGGDR